MLVLSVLWVSPCRRLAQPLPPDLAVVVRVGQGPRNSLCEVPGSASVEAGLVDLAATHSMARPLVEQAQLHFVDRQAAMKSFV